MPNKKVSPGEVSKMPDGLIKDSLEAYRWFCLVEMGFTEEQAMDLLHHHSSIIREKYINKGCSPELAHKILSENG